MYEVFMPRVLFRFSGWPVPFSVLGLLSTASAFARETLALDQPKNTTKYHNYTTTE
jgi:hypothetical protein